MHHTGAVPDRRSFALTAVRSAAILVAILVGYFVAPFGERSTASTYVRAGLAVAVLASVIVIETVAVVRSDHPGRRAVRALTVMVALLLVTSASVYLLISTDDADAFTEPLGHVDALYLSMMTLTTVGFGDIGAVSTAARIAVMVQLVFNFVTIGVATKVVLDRVRRTRDESGS